MDLNHSIGHTRTGTTLETLYPAISQRFALCTVALARARNSVISPLRRLPNEIISQILLHEVYAPGDDLVNSSPTSPTLEKYLLRMVQRRHSLQSVYSIWREIIVSSGAFWSTIPLVKRAVSLCQLELWMERATGRALRLAVGSPRAIPPDVAQYLTSHMSRFCAVNIETRSVDTIHHILSVLLQATGNESIPSLELSIRNLLFRPEIQKLLLASFIDLLQTQQCKKSRRSLSVLRLSGVHFDWETIFSWDTLDELHLHNSYFHSDSQLNDFLQNLSYAPRLRTLQIISCLSSQDTIMVTTSVAASVPKVAFPNLKFLYLDHLSLNTLENLFTTIAPGGYHLTLSLRERSTFRSWGYAFNMKVRIEALGKVLSLGQINTLIIPELTNNWLRAEDLYTILGHIPTLSILELNQWAFTERDWRAIQRPESTGRISNFSFPHLEQILVTQARILEEEGLEDMVESHIDSIQLVELGAINATGSTTGESSYTGSEDIIAWLRFKVPNFCLTDPERLPRDLVSLVEWRLW